MAKGTPKGTPTKVTPPKQGLPSRGKQRKPIPVKRRIGLSTILVAAGILVVLALLVVAIVTSSGKRVAASEKLTGKEATYEKGWIADLGYMRNELLSRHKKPLMLITKGEYNSGIDELVKQVPDADGARMTLALERFLHTLGDPHTYVATDESQLYPISFIELTEGIFIDAEAAPAEHLFLQVRSINGMTPDAIREALAPYLAGGTKARQLVEFCRMLRTPRMMAIAGVGDGPLNIEAVGADGQTATFSVSPSNAEGMQLQAWNDALGERPLYRDDRRGDAYWFEPLPDRNAIYAQINEATSEGSADFQAFVDELFAARASLPESKLVIDLRYNANSDKGGIKPLIDAMKGQEDLIRDQRTVVVFGRNTRDYALSYAMELRERYNALLVGENTGGRPNFFTDEEEMLLSNAGVTVMYPAQRVALSSDDDQTLRPAVDVPVTYSYLTKDDFLEAALAATPKDYRVQSTWGQ